MRSIISMMLVLAVLLVGSTMPVNAVTNNPEDAISGDWDLVINNQGETTSMGLRLKLDGDNVSGEFKSSTPLGNGPVSGRWVDNKIVLTVTTSHATLNMSGVMNKGKLAGDWDTSGMSGKWEATRGKNR